MTKASNNSARVCARCVMDTRDPDLRFDDNGVCNHCHAYDAAFRDHLCGSKHTRNRLDGIVAEIKQRGAHKRYDCIIGVSGGVDSTFVALKLEELGLRPLEQSRCYFVHSYHIESEDPNLVLTTTEYGYPFASGIQQGNIAGFQFHPEKSHKFGMQLFRNFVSTFN